MRHHTIDIPTRTLFGEGTRHSLTDIIGTASTGRVLVIATATTARRTPAKETIDELVRTFPTDIWTGVKPNPRVSDIDACVGSFRDADITHIVGIGGGSVLDHAKATAMALAAGKPAAELLKMKTPLPQRHNTLILMPTTSGTGAELSFGAILTDENSGEKLGLRGRVLAADHAVVDPELTYSAPHDLSMTTGFDVLTHALETWLSTAASPFTADLSRAALERVFAFLPRIGSDPGDVEARREIAYAAMIMGINLALSTTCLPHRLQYPLGAATDTAHAEGLAALYPAWLSHVRPFAPEKMARCAQWIGVDIPGAPDSDNARAFEEAVLALLSEIGLERDMSDLGVTDEESRLFADRVTGRLDTDPGYRNRDDIDSIYAASLHRLPIRK